jgi:hypothetical protein
VSQMRIALVATNRLVARLVCICDLRSFTSNSAT